MQKYSVAGMVTWKQHHTKKRHKLKKCLYHLDSWKAAYKLAKRFGTQVIRNTKKETN